MSTVPWQISVRLISAGVSTGNLLDDVEIVPVVSLENDEIFLLDGHTEHRVKYVFSFCAVQVIEENVIFYGFLQSGHCLGILILMFLLPSKSKFKIFLHFHNVSNDLSGRLSSDKFLSPPPWWPRRSPHLSLLSSGGARPEQRPPGSCRPQWRRWRHPRTVLWWSSVDMGQNWGDS